MTRPLLILALALGALAGISAAPQQAPARDAAFVPTTGIASISGVVVNDEERPQPVRRAVVTLAGPDLRPSRGAVTDDEGRFTIANLPAGRFTLTVSRASYVTSVYGAKRPGRPGTPLSLAAGASITDLTVRLWRGAVVAGVVRDPTGAPVPRVPVTAIPAKPVTSPSILTLSNNGVTTNEQGEFRIFGLEPGAYVVVAKPSSGGSQIQSLRESEIDALLESLRRRTPPPSPVAGSATSPPAFDYAPVYYPAATSPALATVLRLTPGQEVTGLDLTLLRVTTAVVSGVVLLPDGRPAAGAAVQLTAEVPDGPFKPESRLELNATADAEGRFRIVQAAPGEYQIIARAAAAPPPPPTPGIVTPGPVGPQFWASTRLSIGAADVDGLTLNVAPGFTIAGRVVFQSDTQKPPANAALRVFLVPSSVAAQRPGTSITTIAFVPPVTVRPDGTFEVVNLPPGSFRFQISGPALAPGGWSTRSAVMEGRDLLDAEFRIPAGGRGEVTVTLTDKATELSGVLQMASGAPASDVFVIAYAADRGLWGAGARRVQAVRPAVDGRYAMNGLPPGDYLLAAVLDIDPDDWNDPAFLEQLVAASIKVTLGEGEKKTQHLRIN
jgi:hypothetical protein